MLGMRNGTTRFVLHAKMFDPSAHLWRHSTFWAVAFLSTPLHSSQSYPRLIRSFLNVSLCTGWSCLSHAQPPTWWTRVCLVVSVNTFELLEMEETSSSYATAVMTLRIKKCHTLLYFRLPQRCKLRHSLFFWHVPLCKLVDSYQTFGTTCDISLCVLMSPF